MSARGRLGSIIVAALASAAALAPSSGATVTCPVAVASSAGPVQWSLSEYGAPTASSWTLGQGTWTAAGAGGTICTVDKGGGRPTRRLVLKVSGASLLSPKITRLGLLGVGIVLPLRVSVSDDAACARGTTGSATLFASYYSVHRDSIALHFAAGCASHDRTFTGSIVHVSIARDGRQVNTAAVAAS